ncbi:MAG: alpha-mannosidase [Clostridiales bacterium]|nr:alpha-mannosidase [Clostridiales bacterium]
MNRIHLIGNAHIDPVWLWRWQEGYAETLATFRSALDRMTEFPDYKFTSACAAYYEWIKEIDPEMFREIQERVAEGRWCITGGFYIQPDCNAPCGESFARHGLYSQRFFIENFGHAATVGYNVDTFGHCGNLPQLLKKCGLDNYLFMRPGTHEKDLPDSLFNWKGIDGTIVRTKRITNYATPSTGHGERIDRLNDMANREDHDVMYFYGIGNHGGGPTIRSLQELEDEISSRDNIFYSTPNEFFASVRNCNVPTVHDELQHHARGCYSVVSELKKKLRKSETALLSSEKLSVVSSVLLGDRYPKEEITSAWKNVLFNQFHDIAGGCCIESAVNDAIELYDESLVIASRHAQKALQKIAWNIDTSGGLTLEAAKDTSIQPWENIALGTPIVVFNPLSWPVTVPVECNHIVSSIENNDANPVVYQTTRAEKTNNRDKFQTVFLASLPAMGYKVYRLKVQTNETPLFCIEVHPSNVLENDFLKITISPENGMISSVFDKSVSQEVFASNAMSADVIDITHCDTWAHDIPAFDRKVGEFTGCRITVMETGAVRTVIRSESRYGDSVLRQDYTLYSHKKSLDVKVYCDWHEEYRMLKLTFNTALENPTFTCEIPYGFISRDTNGEEEHQHRWADLSSNGYGVSIINDCKYAYSASGSSYSMTCINNSAFADHYGQQFRDEYCRFTDMHENIFSYSVVPHEGSFTDAGVIKSAYEFNTPSYFVVDTFHKGKLPCSASFIYIDSENIICETVKLSEDNKAYTLRCYESHGKYTDTVIELPLIGRSIKAAFSPHEIKTYYIPINRNDEIKDTNFLEL